MPIEAWIMAGICIALELFCIIMMFVLSWPRDCVHGAPFRIPPPPPRPKGGLKPNTMCPPPPPSSAEKQLLRYECEKCGTMQHTYTRQDGIKCIVCGGSMNKVLWFNLDGTSTKPPTRSMI
jgi:hypothetical protein